MDYRKFGETYYIRLDKGEEIVSSIMKICEKEGINSAVYSGIGGCSSAEIQTFIPEKGEFETDEINGMLELVSIIGNIITDDGGKRYQHVHAAFAYKEDGRHNVRAGHIKSITVLYTAEIELRPVINGEIKRKYNPETGTGLWHFK